MGFWEGINPYAYIFDNPINWIDPRGLAGGEGEEDTRYGEQEQSFRDTVREVYGRILEEQARKEAELEAARNAQADKKCPERLQAENVLSYVDANGVPPPGYKGGRQFENDGRDNGEILPPIDTNGIPIGYKEYDIYPRQPGVRRGDDRLVIGSDGRAYLTTDHYQTFTPIN